MNRVFILILFTVFSFQCRAQHLLNNDDLKYQFSLSDSLVQWKDSAAAAENESVFYDNYSGIVLMITAGKGLFASNANYMDCSKADLEQQLQEYQRDSTLKLISCNKSKYYQEEAVELHFESHIYPAGLNRCMIYFIHHNGKEFQLAFIYDKANDKSSLEYIDRIMQTLKLL
jgi:hypothetical protein